MISCLNSSEKSLIRGFAHENAEYAFEENAVFLHVLDSQGLDACVLSFGARMRQESDCWVFIFETGGRITFRWVDGGADDVWIEDYHRG
jgi:hypothetical protein